jgi:hypothetical protein
MKIDFIIGDIEKHEMELSFDQTSGDLRILMDGSAVLQDTPRLAKSSIQRYELHIGDCEQHRLMLQLAYGNGLEIDEPGFQAIPRLSLTVAAVETQDPVRQGLTLHPADSLLSAGAAANV